MVEVAGGPGPEAAHHLGREGLGEGHEAIRPLALIAGISFTENRFPLRRTTGIRPFSPPVPPVTWSDRMPTRHFTHQTSTTFSDRCRASPTKSLTPPDDPEPKPFRADNSRDAAHDTKREVGRAGEVSVLTGRGNELQPNQVHVLSELFHLRVAAVPASSGSANVMTRPTTSVKRCG